MLLPEENYGHMRHSGSDRRSVKTIWPVGMKAP